MPTDVEETGADEGVDPGSGEWTDTAGDTPTEVSDDAGPEAGGSVPVPDDAGPEAGAGVPWEDRWPDQVATEPRGGLVAALRQAPPGLGRGWRRGLIGLLVLQLLVIGVLGVVVALRFPVFSPIDEEAHYSYVQEIAQHGSLPVLGRTRTSPQALAVEERTYPSPATTTYPPSELKAMSYEAFQPPLYYLTAVPAFDLTSNYRDKLFSLRFYDVLLLFASVAAVGRLARVALKDRWMIGWAFTLVFFALPGVIVREVTVSNQGLGILLSILFATELWIAWDRHAGRRYIAAGVVLGLAVLTEFELVELVPVFVLVVGAEAVGRWRARQPDLIAGSPEALSEAPISRRPAHKARRSTRRALAPLAVALAVPLVLAAPWVAYNESTYHMVTAGPLAVAEQAPTVNHYHRHFAISNLPNDTASYLLHPALPDEWGGAFNKQPALSYLTTLLDVLMVPASLVMIVGLGRRLWSIRVAILGLPWVFNLLEMWYIRYGEQWSIEARYTYTALPILLVLAAGGACCVFGSRKLPVVVTMVATGSLVAIWAFLLTSGAGRWALT